MSHRDDADGPHYTLTDAGELAEMLDIAARRWPEERSRKQVLMRLAATGRDAAAEDLAETDQAIRHERQRDALSTLNRLVDHDALLGDAAWR